VAERRAALVAADLPAGANGRRLPDEVRTALRALLCELLVRDYRENPPDSIDDFRGVGHFPTGAPPTPGEGGSGEH
jgi:hypothetical protein